MDLLLRFLIGGAVISFFAVLGDVLKPKSLGGVFAVAPTIALATLALTAKAHGLGYVAVEGRSMLAGGLAFFIYACIVSYALMRYRRSSLSTAFALMPTWAAVSLFLWFVWLRK